MTRDYSEVPILHVLEAMLTDAFNASNEQDVIEWLDGKTLTELVGDDVANQFYRRELDEFEFAASLRYDDELTVFQSHLNKANGPDIVLITVEGRDLPYGRIRFHRGDPAGQTWIGS